MNWMSVELMTNGLRKFAMTGVHSGKGFAVNHEAGNWQLRRALLDFGFASGLDAAGRVFAGRADPQHVARWLPSAGVTVVIC
jgi:hypothetical protein